MEPRSIAYLAAACGGLLLRGNADAIARGISTDSRTCRAGEVFVALVGERFDGHAYVDQVARVGVAAVMVERDPGPAAAGCAVILVANTRLALGRLAARYRLDFAVPVVVVGGSNGKTTTKDILAYILKEKYNTLSSEASFNNDIGVPLTLLKLTSHHQAVVLEIGTNHPGELAPLMRLSQPRYGIMTSLGREHLAFFGDLDGVVAEEGWLAELLPAEGKLFVNGDLPLMESLIQRSRAAAIRVGMNADNVWRGQLIRLDENGMVFKVQAPRAACAGEYEVARLGRHQLTNVLLALAVGAELGLNREELQRGLRASRPAKMRLQLWEQAGIKVLDDSYNANADSMQAALQTLRDLPCAGRRIAVLGDMAELGAAADEAHAEVGQAAAALGIERLFAVGQMAPIMAAAARRAGLDAVDDYREVEAASQAVKAFVRPGDLVLLKASRATHIERIGEALRQQLDGA